MSLTVYSGSARCLTKIVHSHRILLLPPPEMHQFCMFFATTMKLRIAVESPHFPKNSAECHENKKSRRETVMENLQMVMEKSWKCHGKIYCQVCGNSEQIAT